MANLIQKLASKLGAYTTRKRGEEVIFACPRCHREKLEVNQHRELFNCFRRGYSGTLKKILDDLNIEPWKVIEVASIKSPILVELQPITIPKFRPLLLNISYGFASIYTFLKSKGISDYLAHSWGWGISDDLNLRGRLIIPILEDRLIMSYVARSVDGREPKEISGPNKSHFLYNLDGINEGDNVVLVEGIFDCEALRRLELKAAAVLGSNISDIQVGKVLAKRPKSITLVYDGDTAGREGTLKAFEKFHKRNAELIYCVWLPDDKDPDEMLSEDLRRMIMESWRK